MGRTIYVRTIKTRIDALNVKSGDLVIHVDFNVLIDIVQVAMGGDVLLCGDVIGYNSLYDVSSGSYVCWGPKGISFSLMEYLNRHFIGRKP